MCLHKHKTIVHQHLYNNTHIQVYRHYTQGGAGQGTPSISSLQSLQLGGARVDVTRPGCPSFGPVVWETAGLRGPLRPSPCWSLELRALGTIGSLPY